MKPRRKFIISDTVQAQFRKIDQANALAILRKLDRFEQTGVGDVKQLVDIHPPELRLRHGDFRVRFYATAETIELISVTNRKKSYS
jgi:mRNA-degrading endonuclease RelE of RelBE toxin-antitoxin system